MVTETMDNDRGTVGDIVGGDGQHPRRVDYATSEMLCETGREVRMVAYVVLADICVVVGIAALIILAFWR